MDYDEVVKSFETKDYRLWDERDRNPSIMIGKNAMPLNLRNISGSYSVMAPISIEGALVSYINPEESFQQIPEVHEISKNEKEVIYIEQWQSSSMVQKLRMHPREFLAFGTFSAFMLIGFLLVLGLIYHRIIIAPDYGTLFLFIFLGFWLMTVFAKPKKEK
jgi:hypothetical protein